MGRRSEDAMCSVNLEDNAHLRPSTDQCGTNDNNLLDSQTSGISAQPLISQKKGSFIFHTCMTAIVTSGPFDVIFLCFFFVSASQTVATKKGILSELLTVSKDLDVADIDADFEDPQLCSPYAADIYANLRVAEVCVVNALSLLSLPMLLCIESYKNIFIYTFHAIIFN